MDIAVLEQHRRDLTGYCGRMLGSGFDADDAVQETMLRAWLAWNGFQGRSSVRTWLFSIATNVCLDLLRGRRRLADPVEAPPDGAEAERGGGDDPADIAASRDTVRSALAALLHHLPPRQRAALILCDVLRWRASEVAELLGTTVAAVNNALQRARATLASARAATTTPPAPAGPDRLVAGYADAFERYDVGALVALAAGATG
jgi:RNA polymerase sigma-70 factor (ECF subfamily)